MTFRQSAWGNTHCWRRWSCCSSDLAALNTRQKQQVFLSFTNLCSSLPYFSQTSSSSSIRHFLFECLSRTVCLFLSLSFYPSCRTSFSSCATGHRCTFDV